MPAAQAIRGGRVAKPGMCDGSSLIQTDQWHGARNLVGMRLCIQEEAFCDPTGPLAASILSEAFNSCRGLHTPPGMDP